LIDQVIDAVTPESEPDPASEEPAEPVLVEPAPAPEPAAPSIPKPEFDVVRVDAAGNMVMAGRSAPNAEIEILDSGEVLGKATADARGDWVFLPDQQLAPGDRDLTLRAVTPDGDSQESDRSVLVVVPETVREPDATELAEAPTAPAEPIILSAPVGKEESPIEVIQAPAAETADVAPISVDAVEYDESGNVGVSGRAEPDTSVRIYLDDEPVVETATSPEGDWRAEAPESVEPGLYRLRADQVDESGDVTARIELPFKKEDVQPDQFLPGKSYVVQPGNSLWRIARRTYGQGINYVVIYQQNRDQIRDPNLIYPGQIFDLPSQPSE
jgi:nucleoid-associated protein YgaU